MMAPNGNNTSRITMLGTGNAMCVNCYNTCFYLRSPRGGMLVDGGGGNGILRQLIRQYLNTVPNVKKAKDEHVQFGGAGITVVDLE